MLELNDRDHYTRRAAKALVLAENATDLEIAAIHRSMADSYLELASFAEVSRPMLRSVGG